MNRMSKKWCFHPDHTVQVVIMFRAMLFIVSEIYRTFGNPSKCHYKTATLNSDRSIRNDEDGNDDNDFNLV